MMLKKRTAVRSLSIVLLCGLLLCGCSRREDARAYTFRDVYIGAEHLIETHKNSRDCEDIYLNEDGSLTLVLTESQRKKWADPGETEAILIPLKLMGVSIEYSDDYTKMTVSAPDGVAEAASPMICNFAWQAELCQILGGAEDWSLEVTVVNSDTGKIVQQVVLPEEELDWSFMEP